MKASQPKLRNVSAKRAIGDSEPSTAIESDQKLVSAIAMISQACFSLRSTLRWNCQMASAANSAAATPWPSRLI